MNLDETIQRIKEIKQSDLDTLREHVYKAGCVYILGNGGSSSIASHMAEDYTKSLKQPAVTFSDAARLTCYANDYGYDYAYKRWLKEFTPLVQNPFVILISSSGNSENILNCAAWCEMQNITFATLTGFSPENKLTKRHGSAAVVDYHVNSMDYGVVECVHQVFLHGII